MIDLCFAWQNRQHTDLDLLCDVYDGSAWKEFSTSYPSSHDEGTLPLCLALNVDWFQPFQHTQYSVGALYLSILNLPRSLRFKEENVMLAGIIPGPKEPPLNINSFLEPIISDLLKLYHGIDIVVRGVPLHIRAVINLVVCDIPATRKVLALPQGHYNGP